MTQGKNIQFIFEYIDNNLDRTLTLETVSKIALISPFYFHRIFKWVTNETLNQYITRQRIEKAALYILLKKLSITEIAYQLGFKDLASFSKTFKKFYGISPSEFKKQNHQRFSKIGQMTSSYETYICHLNELQNWIIMNAKITIKEIAPLTLGYVSVIGPQNLNHAYQKIIHWASEQGYMDSTTKMATIYHDSFKITTPEKVRMSACIILPPTFKASNGIDKRIIDGGKHIVAQFEISLEEFEKSWTGLFLWMHENGYQKSTNPPFEIYHNNPEDHPQKKAIVDFYIPIE